MKLQLVYRLLTPVMTLLTAVVLSLFWMGQARAAEPTVKVYKNPT
jgi:hypothetical protein